MFTFIMIIHLLLATALIGVVLLQRSEGGALGIGGGGGGGMMSGRAAANLLTRMTAYLAAAFLATSLTLAILSNDGSKPASILDAAPQGEPADASKVAPPLAPAEPSKPMVPLSQ